MKTNRKSGISKSKVNRSQGKKTVRNKVKSILVLDQEEKKLDIDDRTSSWRSRNSLWLKRHERVLAEIAAWKRLAKIHGEKGAALRCAEKQSAQCMVLLDLKGRILVFNRNATLEFERLYNVPLKKGKRLYDLISPSSRKNFNLAFKRAISGIHVDQVTKKVIDSDGIPYYFQIQYQPLRDRKGKTECVALYLLNITQEALLEEQFSENLFFLEETQRAASIGTFRIDLVHNQVNCSQITSKIFGIDPAQLKHALNWLTLIHPDDRKVISDYMKMAVKDGRRKFDVEYRIVHQNETEVKWVYSQGTTKYDTLGKPLEILGTVQDITNRKIAEKRIQEGEIRFRSMIEQGNDMIALIDKHSKIQYISPSISRILGHELDGSGEQRSFIYLHPDDVQIQVNTLKKIMKEPGASASHQVRIRNKEGSYIWIQSVLTNLLDTEGVSAIVINFTDITLLKEKEKELEQQRALLQSLVDAITDSIFVKDMEGRYLFFNPAAQKFTGRTLGEVIRTTDQMIFENPKATFLMGIDQEILEFDQPVTYEDKILSHDGILRDMLVTKGPLKDSKGNTFGLFGISRDITVQNLVMEKMNKLNQAVAQSPASIVITDLHGNIDYVNPSFEKITGYNIQEVLGKNPRLLKSGYTSAGDYENLWKTITQGNQWKGVFQNKKNNGELYWESATISAIRNSHGEITNYLAVKEDITEIKKAEEHLRQTERSYRDMFQSNPNPMFLFDKQSLKFLLVNDAAIRFYGYTEGEFSKMTIETIRPSEKLEYLKQVLNRLGKDPLSDIQTQHKRKDGSIMEVEITSNPMMYNGMNAWLVMVIDITERRKAEQQLEQNRILIESIFNHISDPIYFKDLQGRYQLFNIAAEAFTGKNKEEVLGKDDRILFPEPYASELIEREQSLMNQKKHLTYEEALPDTKGDIHHFLATKGALTDSEGRSFGLYGISHDITSIRKSEMELREAEVRYRSMFEVNPNPMWVFDLNTRELLEVNDSSINHYGYSREEFLSMRLDDLTPSVELPFLFDVLKDAQQKKGIRELYVNHKKKNGEIILVHVISHNLEFSGRPARIAILTDVTEQKKAEEEIMNMNKQLRELAAHIQTVREEERMRISRELHDDIGQQMTAIKMNIEWVKKRIKGSQPVSQPELVSQKMHELTEMVDETVESVKRINSEIRPWIIDELGLIEALEDKAIKIGKQFHIRFEFQNEGPEPAFSPEIKINIYRIIQESINNIIKHAKAYVIKLRVRNDGDSFIVTISDDGQGFLRGQSSHENSFGILSMKERALTMNAKVDIESAPGRGTTVTLAVPLQAPFSSVEK